ncbi:MAG: hypothetical protein CMH36_08785 [Microbacterium sp.]|jgi:hypothetical protein|uniref:Uncharacterized protein n=1 Tax=Microbacterium ginsengisoli TaxID=400772 RepID=A0A3C1K8M0_9MICO|nr:hypothetical protein [Microbacterium sp. 4NA327F11]MAL06906.1 hypothetical protein [Microbacterium sp.]MCK9913752.1 hypothetical protein [Microbacteriaceae bacterium K1510]HAN23021.1 hypothetical protein [Microbacterium ginsengisoli]|tara:strand:+ start:581 stop:820 length:240 start_codon:yes stop_codon:yes gene_type:complete
MDVSTAIQTRHDISEPGGPFSAAMILDDNACGVLMVNSADGPVFSMDPSLMRDLLKLLTTCELVRADLARAHRSTVLEF